MYSIRQKNFVFWEEQREVFEGVRWRWPWVWWKSIIINSLSQLSIWKIIQDYPLSLITQGRWHSEIFEDAVQPPHSQISLDLLYPMVTHPNLLTGVIAPFSPPIPWVPWRFSHHGQGERIWKTTRWSKRSPQTMPKGLLLTRGLVGRRSGKHGKGVFGKLNKNRCIRPPWNYRTVCPVKIKGWKMKFPCGAWVYFRELC